MEAKDLLPYGTYFLGAVLGIVVPYARYWLAYGEPVDWRQVGAKALAAVFGLVLLPTFGNTLQELTTLGAALSFLAGLGATLAGHEVQSIPAALRAGRMRGVL
jgi:hypothetical protein